MMNMKKLTIALCAASIAVASSFVVAQNQAYKMKTPTPAAAKNTVVMVTPSDITWMDGPDFLPAGAQYAVLDGDPKGSGMYTIRVKLPANYQIAPHFSPTAKRVTVISGTLNTAQGDKMDTSGGTALAAGSFMSIPANLHHFEWTTDETVLQVSGQAPMMVKYVNSNDDPRKAGKTMTTQPAGAPSPSTPTMPSSTTPTPTNNTGSSPTY